MKVNISILLDKRRAKKATSKNDQYPAKLRAYSPTLEKTKMYSLGIDLSTQDYDRLFKPQTGQRLSEELKHTKIKLDAFLFRANEVADQMDSFTFDLFERNYFRDKKSANSVLYHYNEKINILKISGKVGTADSYQCSLKSIEKYLKTKNRTIEALKFAEIDRKWLEGYEFFMTNGGKSKTTIGIYLRPLSSIFNNAIESKDVSRDYYPFGIKKYTIPKGGGVKKALTLEQLKTLYFADTKTPQQEKAKDFWLLSYLLNGMNIQDIAGLKYKDLKPDRIEFVRAKTQDTNKRLKQITTFLNDQSQAIIEKYQTKPVSNDNYVFPILENGLTAVEIKKRVKLFTRFINQHVKIIAQDNDLPSGISSYWARHTFATTAVNKGASLEFMSEALGHNDLKTTQVYFAGFTNDTKKEFAKGLLDF
jgi:integrase/recombinase XerD